MTYPDLQNITTRLYRHNYKSQFDFAYDITHTYNINIMRHTSEVYVFMSEPRPINRPSILCME